MEAGSAVIEANKEIFVFGSAANKKVVRAPISPLFCEFTEEAEVLLSQGILLEDGKMAGSAVIEANKEIFVFGSATNKKWLSLNEKGEHHVEISIKAFSNLDGFSEIENSRFAVGCCKINDFKELKLRVTKPLLLSPNVTYGLNLVVHCSEREKNKQPYVGVSYKIEGETKISILSYEDKREGNWLVAELYQYTSYEYSTLDLEILFEDCGLAGDFYIEGIEFRPLEKAESALVETNEEIVTAVWLSLNEKEEHIAVISLQVYMMGDHHDGLFIMENSSGLVQDKAHEIQTTCHNSIIPISRRQIWVKPPYLLW
nr:protein kinase-like domain, phloem protein 2-like protein [Tanacetum cinerariifolium]